MNPKTYTMTKQYMSTFENKTADLKNKLKVVNSYIKSYSDNVKYYTNTAEDIKAEIEKLEKAETPKQGDVYKNVYSSFEYILARVDHFKYGLINLSTGERFRDSASSIEEAFGHYPENFVKVKR